jgi:DDE superfamily endonuclease
MGSGWAWHLKYVIPYLNQQNLTSYREVKLYAYLSGDSGYAAEPWLLTPMPNMPDGTPEAAYTVAHCSTRNCVERCIGLLKGRWRCLTKDRALHYTPRQAGLIINSCAVLHNVAIRYRVPEPPHVLDAIDMMPPEDAPALPAPPAPGIQNPRLQPANLRHEALQVRNHLIRTRFD